MRFDSQSRHGAWRFIVASVLFVAVSVAPALADEVPGDCLGIDFDLKHPVSVAKVKTDKPHVNFIKSTWEDAACPTAGGDACAAKAYLVPGDLVLIGKTNASLTCVAYQSAEDKKQRWTNDWLPSASLVPVTPLTAASRAEWVGGWIHAGGEIDITNAANGAVSIHGEQVYQAAQDTHNGVIDAKAKPDHGILAFADDGKTAFDDPKALCLVRMRRVEALLVVEDNNACGGITVTFTGFYRRK
jgi:hypothetical protein